MTQRALMMLTGAAAAMMLATAAFAQPAVERSVKVEPGGLYEIVFNPADSDVYVAAVGPRGADAAAVARLDGATLEAEGLFGVAATPLYGLALNAATQTLYGTDTRSGHVVAISVATGETIAEITSDREGAHIRQVAVDEANNRIYVSEVAGRGDAPIPSRIWIIDGADNSLERVIDVAGTLTGLAVDVANNRAFSTDMVSNEVVVVDLASGQTTHRWPVGSENTINVAHDAAGERLFVTAQGTGDLTVMNASDGSVIHKVATGEGALSVAWDAPRDRIYVANRRAGTVSVIDGTSYEVLANLETGTFPQTIAINPADGAVYVTNKARGLPRGAPAGTPVPVDPTGDVVTLIRP